MLHEWIKEKKSTSKDISKIVKSEYKAVEDTSLVINKGTKLLLNEGVSIISRGQVEILIVSIALISLYFYKRDKIFLSASLIAILGFIKVFPLLLSLTFIKSYRNKKFFIYVILFI